MAETSHGIITDDTNIGVSNVNEVNLTQPITHGTSPRNVTHNASDNTHTNLKMRMNVMTKVPQLLQLNKMFHLVSKIWTQLLLLIL